MELVASNSTGIDILVGFVMIMIFAVVGINIVPAILTTIENLEGQLTLVFVTIVILGVIIFMGMMAKLTSSDSNIDEGKREYTPEENIQLIKDSTEQALGEETTGWNCKNCGGPNHHEFCQYCGKAKE